MKTLSLLIAPAGRPLALAALLGVTLLAGPFTPVWAAQTGAAPTQVAPATTPPARMAGRKMETVEQRITTLHASLKITAEQEPKWAAVAQAMRDNALAMDKLVAEAKATPKENLSAVGDLKRYQKFAEAHVEGLKHILASFESLYAMMPDAQKKIADGVFESAGHHTVAGHG